ncbi:dihydroorotate dehydrogenase electron transfer subunit [Candidatus Margulisiibacteriota bacterium]
MKFQENAKVLETTYVASHHFKVSLFSPKIAKDAKPGQFVMVKCENGSFDPLLRRPLSLHRIGKDKIEILFKVIGKGTLLLSELKKGDTVNLIGPLGNEFTVNKDIKEAVIMGGGVGVAPLLSLAESIKDRVKAVYVVIGATSQKDILCKDDFRDLGAEVIISTDDGSEGIKGKATDILPGLLESKLSSNYAQIFACGPRPMYRELRTITLEYKIPCQISLEEWMGCGIGACNGCTCETKEGYKKVCKDGPVFDIGDIKW